MMSIPKQLTKLYSKGTALFIAVLLTATIVPQLAGVKVASADDGGYPWVGATPLYPSPPNYDWGYYPSCPSNDTYCMKLPVSYNGNTYGAADPWVYYVRNCTSYVAWAVSQNESVNVSGWGDAYQWSSNAPSNEVHAASGYTPQVGDIAQWVSHDHVAYVWKVSGTTAYLAEYNSGYPKNGTSFQWGLFYNGFTSANYPVGGPNNYIHIGSPTSPFFVRTGTDAQAKKDLGSPWLTPSINSGYPGAADLRVAGNSSTTRISYTDTNGAVWAEDNLTNSWANEYTNPSQYAISPYIFLIRTGTTVSGKSGLTDAWTPLNGTPATDIRLSNGGRISYTDTSGDVWAKDWLGGQWYDEYPSPTQHAASDQLFVVRTGTNVQAKVNLGDPWSIVLNNTPATDIRANDGRLTYTDTSGDVWARDGLGGAWYDEYTNPSQYAASGSLFVIRTGTDIQAKVNLGDPWTLINGTPATDVQVHGNRITYTDTSGHVWAKDSLTGTWYDEYTNPSQYATGSS